MTSPAGALAPLGSELVAAARQLRSCRVLSTCHPRGASYTLSAP
jgi:hypothetical protein